MKSFASRSGWGVRLGLVAVAWGTFHLFAASELQAPFRVEARGKPIDLDGGNAAPFITNFDGPMAKFSA